MAKASAKDKIVESMGSMLSNVENAVKEAVKVAAVSNPDDPISKLGQLEKEYQTVNVKIYRKQPNGAKYEFFTELPGFPLSELLERGPDSICREEGGGGEYTLKIHVPGDRGAARVSFPVTISGPSRMAPAHGMGLDASFGFGAGMGLPGFGLPNSTPFGAQQQQQQKKEEDGKAAWAQQRQYEQLMQTAQNSNDRMMMMMMQQQQQQQAAAQQQQQMMAQMFAGMFTSQKENGSSAAENERVRHLEEKMERMRQEAQQREELSRRDRELSELKQRMEMIQTAKPQSSEKDWLVPLMTMMNSSNSQQMGTIVEFMKMAQDKPSEMERMGNFMATISSVMNNSFEGQAHLLQVMKEMNSGGELTGKDFLFKGLEGMMELGSQALEASVARAQARAETSESQNQMQTLPPPAPYATQTLPPPSSAGAIGALPEHAEEDDDEDGESIEVELLTSAELDRFDRDAALQKAVASLMNGDHPSEATARLFFHAQSGNAIAQKWLNFPYDITEQVLGSFDARTLTVQKLKANGQRETVEVDLVQSLGDDVVAFSEYLEKGQDPAKWAKTGYTPKKRAQSLEDMDPAVRPTNLPPTPVNEGEDLDFDSPNGENEEEPEQLESEEESDESPENP